MSEPAAIRKLPKKLRKHYYEAMRIVGERPSISSFLHMRERADLEDCLPCYECSEIERRLRENQHE